MCLSQISITNLRFPSNELQSQVVTRRPWSALGFRLFPRYFFRVQPCLPYALAAVRIGLSRHPAWYRGPSVATPTPIPDHVTELCMPPDRLVHAMAYPNEYLTYSNVTCTCNCKLFQRTDSRVLHSTENYDARAGKAIEYLTER